MQHYILDKIKENTKTETEGALLLAKHDADAQIQSAKQEIAEKVKKQVVAMEKGVKIAIEQELHTAKIRLRKAELKSKQSHIDDVFEAVRVQLSSPAQNKKLVESLKTKFAKPGDKVKEADGGIVIENKSYELSLTLMELLQELRGDVELELSKILFG